MSTGVLRRGAITVDKVQCISSSEYFKPNVNGLCTEQNYCHWEMNGTSLRLTPLGTLPCTPRLRNFNWIWINYSLSSVATKCASIWGVPGLVVCPWSFFLSLHQPLGCNLSLPFGARQINQWDNVTNVAALLPNRTEAGLSGQFINCTRHSQSVVARSPPVAVVQGSELCDKETIIDATPIKSRQ